MKISTMYQSLAMLFMVTLVFVSCKNETTEKEPIQEADSKDMAVKQTRSATALGYGIGDVATDFKLKDVDGDMVSLSDYDEAQGFIVIFTCNTCPFAVASEDRINALDAKYKDQGYPVIAINPNDPAVQPDDTYELMQAKAADKKFTFPYLYDANDKVYAAYGATKTPHVYLLKKEKGLNIVKYIGAIDDNVRNGDAVKEQFLANAIDALLQGKEIKVKETKAIGCSIKV